MNDLGYAALAMMAATLGALGGMGGALLLVPALVVTGMSASDAAPLGLLTVAAGSVAAAPRQLIERSVNHRIGVTTELVSSTAAVIGAIGAGLIGEQLLTYVLASVALAAAVAGFVGGSEPDECDPGFGPDDVGERVGGLDGAYPLGDGVVPYQLERLPLGLGLMGVAGLIAGVAGAPGGFIKTPATSLVMGVPLKVAAATTTFTVGVTASAALVVMAVQGRIDVDTSAIVVVGSLLGGMAGARMQSAMSPATVRRVLSGLLLVVAVVLVVR